MTKTAQALYAFFSGFGIPAYAEYAVPDEAELPYITYQVSEPDWRDETTFYARVWYRDTSFAALNATVDAIRQAVGEGVRLATGGGALYLFKGTPFVQIMPMEGDDTLRVAYVNFGMHAVTT